METVLLARDVLSAKQEIAAQQRETVFNLRLAQNIAAKIIRQGLKGFDKLKGLPKPEYANEVRALKKQGLKRKAILKTLGIDVAEYSQALRYWKASLAERETVETPSHCSIVNDVVNSAYLLWVEANYTNWQNRCDKAMAKGEIAEPQSTGASVKYAHGNYWKPQRKPEQRRQREENIVAHSGLRAAGAKGSARTIVTDLSDELGEKAKQVARLLSSGSSSADVADMLGVSRPTVSVHCKKIAAALTLHEKFAALEPSKPETAPTARDVANYWRERVKTENRYLLAEIVGGSAAHELKPLAARIRSNVEASRAARLVGYSRAVSLAAKPRAAELGEYAIAAAYQTVSYARRLAEQGLSLDGSAILTTETARAAEQAAELLASRRAVSREPSTAREPSIDVATIRERLPQFFNVETETDKLVASKKLAASLVVEELKAAEIARRNLER